MWVVFAASGILCAGLLLACERVKSTPTRESVYIGPSEVEPAKTPLKATLPKDDDSFPAEIVPVLIAPFNEPFSPSDDSGDGDDGGDAGGE